MVQTIGKDSDLDNDKAEDEWLKDIGKADTVKKALGSNLRPVGEAYFNRIGGYCIDPNTPASIDNDSKDKRTLDYIIDIDNCDTVVYGRKIVEENDKKIGKIKKYTVTGNDRQPLLAWAHIAYQAKEEQGENKDWKIAFQYYLWGYQQKFKRVGISENYWYRSLQGGIASWKGYNTHIKGENGANTYANKITKIKFTSAKTKPKIKNFDDNYYLVGPYKINFQGEVKPEMIYGNDGNFNTDKVRVNSQDKKLSELKSGEQFYVKIPKDLIDNKQISSLNVESTEFTAYKARIAITRGKGNKAVQNYIIYKAKEEKNNKKVKLNVPEPPAETNLVVQKIGIKDIDKDGTEIPDNPKYLAGVGFIVVSEKDGYVHQDANKKITYHKNDRTKATTFITEEDGKITIPNLKPGRYVFIETVNPYEGYKLNIGKRTIIVHKAGDNKTHTIKNTKEKPVNLTIKKVAKKINGSEEPLPNVKFKLKSSLYGYVQQTTDSKGKIIIKYTADFNAATEFVTGADGKKTIEGLKQGEYTFIETYVPEGYELSLGKEETFDVTETTEEKVINPEGYGSVIIVKRGIVNDKTKIPLNGIEFKLKHSTLGFVKQENNQTTYTDNEAEATKFETGLNGDGKTIQINNLKLGSYTAIESYIKTSADGEQYKDNDSYKENEGKTHIVEVTQSSPTSPVEITIDNPINDKIPLKIIKKGTNGKPLQGVRFKVKNNIYGYLYYNGEVLDYTQDESSAKEFETGTDGTVTIPDVKVGDYTIYETYNPNEGYVKEPNLEFKNIIVKQNEANICEIVKENDPERIPLKIVKSDAVTKEPLEGVKFILENMDTEKGFVKQRGKNTIYTTSREYAEVYTTDKSGEVFIDGLEKGIYKLYEIENPNDGYITNPEEAKWDLDLLNLENAKESEILKEVQWSDGRFMLADIPNTPQRYELKIIKKDKNSGKPMGGVGFIVGHNTKGYVSESGDSAQYTDDVEDAEIFYTDTEGDNIGTKTIGGLIKGEYSIYEVENPYYGFEVDPDVVLETVNLPSKDNEESLKVEIEIENEQTYIKLGGYVWEDLVNGKTDQFNDLYDKDNDEQKLSNIQVELKNKTTGEVIATTSTDEEGYYEFEDILIEELGNYKVEFFYNGFKYKDVDPNIDKDNGSKAKENPDSRNSLDGKFEKVEHGESTERSKGITKDSSDNVALELNYQIDETAHTANLETINKIRTGNETGGGEAEPEEILVNADTERAKYSIKDTYEEKSKEGIIECIENINLGLKLREQPDMSLVKDIQNVKVAINGYEHIYEYAQRFVNQNEFGDGHNDDLLGVKFGNKYGTMKYTRPIYKSDYMWENPNDPSKNLEVYITYKIQIKNKSTTLKTRINSIVDYYDRNYELIDVGRTLSGNGIIGNSIIDRKDNEFNDDYRKLEITTSDVTIESAGSGYNNTEDIYIQFKLNRQKVQDILGNGELLDNVAEINSYTTFDKDGKVYAGIDGNSAPGNAIPGNTATYEDDTDTAPALKLEVKKGSRQISGTVFLDKTSENLLTAQIREGNGQLDSGESGIKGVKVKLVEKSGTGKVYYANGDNDGTGNTTNDTDSKTDENGNFTISGFIPGDYEIVYTWGNNLGGYTVQDYKGTVYDEERYNNINKANEDSGELEGTGTNTNVYKWYKEENPRYTDAIDNYETRKQIDDELKTKTYSSDDTVDWNKTMDSTTQLMKLAVEYDDEAFKSSDHSIKYEYKINHMDFGIVRRARQSVELNKRVSAMKVTLANGQVVSDVRITEKGGTLQGDTKEHTTYMGPSASNAGFTKIELDNELLQGSKVEVTYEFKFVNKSEVDVMNETYYKFGSKSMKQTDEAKYELKKETAIAGYARQNEVVTIKPITIVDYLDRDWGYEASKNLDWTAITKEQFKSDYKDKNLVTENIFGQDSAINNRIILINNWENGKFVLPGNDITTNLYVSKLLNTTDDITLDNETEILGLEKTGGATIKQTPGNYVPTETPQILLTEEEKDTDVAETVIVTPSTGANLAIVIPITIAVVALLILGTGIVLIKKKVIDIKK